MVQDYPDYTGIFHLIGADIMLPIDVQAAYIMMPVDIQAQYIDLDINIKSQTANVNVNIAASAVTLNVNLSSQSVNINIDIEAQSVGIFLQPDWQAKEGNDKNFRAADVNTNWGDGVGPIYQVPTGKTLYITGMSGAIIPTASTDYDHFHYCREVIYKHVDGGNPLAEIGGVGGVSIQFTKPITFQSEEKMALLLTNHSGVECSIYASCWGFEL